MLAHLLSVSFGLGNSDTNTEWDKEIKDKQDRISIPPGA